MQIDILVAEIGSTTTKVNAFHQIRTGCPRFLGQGQSPTSVAEGDVNIGLGNAIEALKRQMGVNELTWKELFASSSAAGGLRMSVHGLVYDMTVKAAKEAALGAGGIVKLVTAGKLGPADLARIKKVNPNIILVAGGVDYGEKETAKANFELLAKNCAEIPIIYAGNIQNHDDVQYWGDSYGLTYYLTDNVYPRVDMLNVEPTRKIIQNAFEENIIHAPGMMDIRKLVDGPIIPTPGAVMESAKILYQIIGDLIVFDIGGATTDLYSVTYGSEDIGKIMMHPEPFAKRTVEGDLGVFVNIPSVVEMVGKETLKNDFPNIEKNMAEATPIPQTGDGVRFIERLAKEAALAALDRHAGVMMDIYGPDGRRKVAYGKDLTAVKYIVGTGGALTRLPNGADILASIKSDNQATRLFPRNNTQILMDNDYLMSSLGMLSIRYPDAASYLLKKTLKLIE